MKRKPVTVKFSETELGAIDTRAASLGKNRSEYIAWLINEDIKVLAPRQHGGNRWYQCGRCKGWNVGDSGDGIKRCADCGWDSDE